MSGSISQNVGVSLQNSGTLIVGGTTISLPSLTGPIIVPAGANVSNDTNDATLVNAMTFSAPGNITATPGTTITLAGNVWAAGTLDLVGNIDALNLGIPSGSSFGNMGTIFASGASDTIGAISGNLLVVGGTTTSLTFLGSPGAATVYGGGAGGLIGGGSGKNNFLAAVGGATTVLGSSGGSDTLIAGGAAQSTMLAATPNDLVFASEGNCTVFGAASGTDTLVGGNTGAATLVGTTGNDLMWGGLGQDILFGGSGDETLVGGAGNTTLVAGTGSSTLIGGSGNQVFVGSPILSLKQISLTTVFTGTGNSVLFTDGVMDAVLQNQPGATDTVVLQNGTTGIWSGTGTDIYEVINGNSSGYFNFATIARFKPGVDSLDLFGYAPNSATVTSLYGSALVTLSDNTHILFLNLSPQQVLPNIHYF